MPYSPAEAMRTNSWRLRMAYSPREIERHHPVWAEEMEKRRDERKSPSESVLVFPHAQIDALAAD